MPPPPGSGRPRLALLGRPKSRPRSLQEAPRPPPETPSSRQDAQDRSKIGLRGFEARIRTHLRIRNVWFYLRFPILLTYSSFRPKSVSEGILELNLGQLGSSKVVKSTPRAAQERPKSSPRAAQERPRATQERPTEGQYREDGLKSGQEGPKTASEPPKGRPKSSRTPPRTPPECANHSSGTVLLKPCLKPLVVSTTRRLQRRFLRSSAA